MVLVVVQRLSKNSPGAGSANQIRIHEYSRGGTFIMGLFDVILGLFKSGSDTAGEKGDKGDKGDPGVGGTRRFVDRVHRLGINAGR